VAAQLSGGIVTRFRNRSLTYKTFLDTNLMPLNWCSAKTVPAAIHLVLTRILFSFREPSILENKAKHAMPSTKSQL